MIGLRFMRTLKRYVNIVLIAVTLGIAGMPFGSAHAQLPDPPAPPAPPQESGPGSGGPGSGGNNEASIPTTNEWGMIAFVLIISSVAIYRSRKEARGG